MKKKCVNEEKEEEREGKAFTGSKVS